MPCLVVVQAGVAGLGIAAADVPARRANTKVEAGAALLASESARLRVVGRDALA